VLGSSAEVDAGGNKKLPPIGEFMVGQISKHFKAHGKEATVKYIDPSYTIRSVVANSDDAYYCQTLASGAVHGVMAGFTGFSVGMVRPTRTSHHHTHAESPPRNPPRCPAHRGRIISIRHSCCRCFNWNVVDCL
jgi:6-phosphofructokinase 1